MESTVEFEVLTDEELAEVVGGTVDVYRAIGMCSCGGGLHDA